MFRRLFASVQAEAHKVLAEWKAARLSHKQALKELSRIRTALCPAPEAEQAGKSGGGLRLSELALRCRIRHIPWNRTGVLLEVDERKKRVRLDFDGVSLWADAADIELPDAGGAGGKRELAGKATAGGLAGNTGNSSPLLPLRLDLRGLRADVAVSELEKFLDSAILGGREEVELVHGRGTGVLRREIHAFLKNFPAVRDYRLAPEGQGGDGMTIVGLR